MATVSTVSCSYPGSGAAATTARSRGPSATAAAAARTGGEDGSTAPRTGALKGRPTAILDATAAATRGASATKSAGGTTRSAIARASPGTGPILGATPAYRPMGRPAPTLACRRCGRYAPANAAGAAARAVDRLVFLRKSSAQWTELSPQLLRHPL